MALVMRGNTISQQKHIIFRQSQVILGCISIHPMIFPWYTRKIKKQCRNAPTVFSICINTDICIYIYIYTSISQLFYPYIHSWFPMAERDLFFFSPSLAALARHHRARGGRSQPTKRMMWIKKHHLMGISGNIWEDSWECMKNIMGILE